MATKSVANLQVETRSVRKRDVHARKRKVDHFTDQHGASQENRRLHLYDWPSFWWKTRGDNIRAGS
ncbi:MAG: hypothetical protein KatS3mg105_0763 [Gemmatales bacterium]|nr:MAG: hypothetical protein KatS3mg105_0763 [Gemmatales bacterium]